MIQNIQTKYKRSWGESVGKKVSEDTLLFCKSERGAL